MFPSHLWSEYKPGFFSWIRWMISTFSFSQHNSFIGVKKKPPQEWEFLPLPTNPSTIFLKKAWKWDIFETAHAHLRCSLFMVTLEVLSKEKYGSKQTWPSILTNTGYTQFLLLIVLCNAMSMSKIHSIWGKWICRGLSTKSGLKDVGRHE